MSGELIFLVDGSAAVPAEPVTLSGAGLKERDHLQEWVKAYPQMLGDDLLIITDEFDRWVTSTGQATYERLDVLALTRAGQLVVAELKRDRAPDTVALQALSYAAMVSRFSVDDLTDHYAARTKVDVATALNTLKDWAPELADDTLGPPRIVLVAGDFGPVVTNTALFLYENGIDIRLVRAQLFRTAEERLLLSVSQVLPVPSAEEFMIRPRSGPVTSAATRQARQRRASVPERLVAHGVLADDEPLTLFVPVGIGEDRETIDAWLTQVPARCEVRWRNDPKAPLFWQVTGQTYSFAGLVRALIQAATELPSRTDVWGPNWVRNDGGSTLARLAEPLA